MNTTDGNPLQRYVPLVIWILAIAALFYIPLKIIGLGFAPPDDALRHVAKALSGKNWTDILVMRGGITIDHNAGWHAVLGLVHNVTGWGADGLVTFSVAALCGLFLLAPLMFTRRPEAWIIALLAIILAYPHFPFRFMLGRPYILVMATFMAILQLWKRRDFSPGPGLWALTALLISLAAWIHGGWYMYWLPAAGLLLAQRWRAAILMAGCWLAGSFLGGLYTGHPIYFLEQQFQVLVSCFSHHTVQRVLASEFLPTDGQVTIVFVAGLLVLARKLSGESVRGLLRDPILMMAALCWVFGLMVRRFSLDWGIPALLVWMMGELKALLERISKEESMERLAIAGLACLAIAFSASADLESRWTHNLTKEYVTPETPGIGDWLPEPGGILYADATTVFFDTFHKNPKAPWRYMVGFEPTFMPEEDLNTYRKIQWNFGTPEAYQPWVKKLRPEDRLVLKRPKGARPDIPELEWHYAATDTWIGRLPRAANVTTSAGNP